MKNILPIVVGLSFVFLFSQDCLSQNQFIDLTEDSITITGTFCDRSNDSSIVFIELSDSDLESCNFKIHCDDPKFKVFEFQLSLVPSSSLSKYSEELIKLSYIPEKYRQAIISQTKIMYLERIRAVNDKGEKVNVKPFGIRIKSR